MKRSEERADSKIRDTWRRTKDLWSRSAHRPVSDQSSSPAWADLMIGSDPRQRGLRGLPFVSKLTLPGSRRRAALCLRLFLYSCWIGASLLGMGASPQFSQPTLVKHKFTMARIRYSTGNFNWFGFGGQGPPWSHDYPQAHQHLMKILAEVTKLDVNGESPVVSFEEEEVFKYPIAYLCEVGYLDLSEKEAHNMREYLLRGGFLIVDDFRGDRELDNFKQQMKMVFPERSLEELERTHAIFNCFYDISNLFPLPPYARNFTPQYLGMKDDHGRLMMVVDYNNDISEYWEWSNDPIMPIEQTNEAFKYGVNYVIYALTH